MVFTTYEEWFVWAEMCDFNEGGAKLSVRGICPIGSRVWLRRNSAAAIAHQSWNQELSTWPIKAQIHTMSEGRGSRKSTYMYNKFLDIFHSLMILWTLPPSDSLRILKDDLSCLNVVHSVEQVTWHLLPRSKCAQFQEWFIMAKRF